MIQIERATEDDLAALYHIDPDAYHSRHAVIEKALRERQITIARSGFDGVGYAIVDQSFFEQWFIRCILVHAEQRRRGVASALIAYSEKICPRDRLFTSCPASHSAYIRLCEKLGYMRSGSIDHLRDNDPQLIFVKKLERP